MKLSFTLPAVSKKLVEGMLAGGRFADVPQHCLGPIVVERFRAIRAVQNLIVAVNKSWLVQPKMGTVLVQASLLSAQIGCAAPGLAAT